MTCHLDSSSNKQKVIDAYNAASAGFDVDARRFFRSCATRLVELTKIGVGDRVLDIGTGTGAAAFAADRLVAPNGYVVGVDIAPKMLEQARRALSATGVRRLDFVEMDAECLSFPDESFDSVVCAFAIFYMPAMPAALREWRRVLKQGGRVGFSSPDRNAFQPVSDLFEARARYYGATFSAPKAFAWQRLSSPEECSVLLNQAGFKNVQVCIEQHGYYLKDARDWWEIIWNGSWRQAISHLSSEQIEQFKSDHLAEVEAIWTGEGLWLNVEAIFAVGEKS